MFHFLWTTDGSLAVKAASGRKSLIGVHCKIEREHSQGALVRNRTWAERRPR